MFDDLETDLAGGHQACPCGKSSNAFSYFDDGHGYCYSTKCPGGKNWFSKDELERKGGEVRMDITATATTSSSSATVSLSSGVVSSISDRKITKETCKFFGVTLTLDENGREQNHFYPYHDAQGKHIANKIRGRGKSFRWEGAAQSATLFGQNTFGSNSARAITITEGELDALACYQLLGSRYPVVSIKDGASSAEKTCKENYKYLDSFDTITICFDSDEHGRNASKKVSQLFPNKSKVMNLTLHDPSDYLKENKHKEFTERWFSAERYTPANIVRGEDLRERLQNQQIPESLTLPWMKLQELTYGIRRGEMWTITSGTGMGKTQVLRELSYHIQQHTEDNIGLLFLEDPLEDAARGLMSISAGKPLHLPTTEFTQDEWDAAFMDTLGTSRYVFFDSFGSNDIDTIITTIRYMHFACDCKYILLDHISILVSDQSAGDERKALDEIATKLRTLTVELDIWLGMVCHSRRPTGKPHEEGGQTSISELRGTAGIGQLSNMVLGLERNGQEPDLYKRNVTLIRVLKNRFSGLTGPTSYLYYDKETGRLTEVEDPERDSELEMGDDE